MPSHFDLALVCMRMPSAAWVISLTSLDGKEGEAPLQVFWTITAIESWNMCHGPAANTLSPSPKIAQTQPINTVADDSGVLAYAWCRLAGF